jgi:hypothetical protein
MKLLASRGLLLTRRYWPAFSATRHGSPHATRPQHRAPKVYCALRVAKAVKLRRPVFEAVVRGGDHAVPHCEYVRVH